jgi:hypothetical protein
MKAVYGGGVAINQNGELGQYFISFKGPFPVLFNLVADGFSQAPNITGGGCKVCVSPKYVAIFGGGQAILGCTK